MRRALSLAAFLLAAPPLLAQGFAPDEARRRMTVPDGFAARLVACEPLVRQPVSISFDEPDVALVVFELGDRLTGPCDAPAGTLAAARFVFREGRLHAWQQVPVPDDAGATTRASVA